MCENFTEIPYILSERNATRLAEKRKERVNDARKREKFRDKKKWEHK